MHLLECNNICKSFTLSHQPLNVLDRVSFSVDQGDIVVLVGKSGCGKSTLLRILAGLLSPDKGAVLLDGRQITAATPNIGILFQSYAVFPWLTVRANVEAGLLHRALPRKERRIIADKYLEMVGLCEFAHARPAALSGGMQQRVGLARTYAMNATVLLMDEPFGALDALTRREMQRDLLRIHREEAKAVVFVTHDIDEAVQLASRIMVLSFRPATVVHVIEKVASTDTSTLHLEVAAALEASLNGTNQD